MSRIKQFELWIADLNPRFGTEAGKRRPVCVVQTNLLNSGHPSTIVCPVTTNMHPDVGILRVAIHKGQGGVKENCAVMVDQVRAIDNQRLIKKTGDLPKDTAKKLKENLLTILDLI